MSKVKQYLLLVMAAVLLIIPAYVLFRYPVSHFSSINQVIEDIGFILGTVYVFGVPLIVWASLAFICYWLGWWLLTKCMKGKSGMRVLILSEVLMSLPLCVLILSEFFGKYEGP